MFLCLFLLNFQFIFPIFQYLFLVCIQRCAINPAFPPDYLNIKMLAITMLFAGFKHFLRTHFKAHFVKTSKMWKHRMSKCMQLRVNVSGSFVCKSFSPIVAIQNVILFSIPSFSAFARSNAHEMQLKFKSTLCAPNIKFNNSVLYIYPFLPKIFRLKWWNLFWHPLTSSRVVKREWNFRRRKKGRTVTKYDEK